MKLFMTTIAINILSISCVIGAILLAYNDLEGWGWFLLVAAICSGGSVKYSKEDDDG